MREFFRSVRMKVIACVAAVLLLSIIAASVTHLGGTPLASAMGVIFSPLQRLSSFIVDQVGTFTGGFASAGTYREENEALKQQIAALQEQLVDYEAVKEQKQQYEELLQIKEQHPDFTFAPAVIIGRDPSDPFYSFTINKGKANDIAVNDPVMAGPYLIGKVTSVHETYAKVRTILDPQVSASAYERATKNEGYVTGDSALAAQRLCRLSNLKSDTTIAAGGYVCTSGVGGVFPRDLIIGTVQEVRKDNRDISLYAVVKPGVDIPSLQAITVITSFQGQGVSQTEE